MDNLHPCKVCGSNPKLRTADTTEDGPSHYYRCKPCGNRSGIFFKVEDAATHWNRVNPATNPNSRAMRALARAKEAYCNAYAR